MILCLILYGTQTAPSCCENSFLHASRGSWKMGEDYYFMSNQNEISPYERFFPPCSLHIAAVPNQKPSMGLPITIYICVCLANWRKFVSR
jgi:hypothetical protein